MTIETFILIDRDFWIYVQIIARRQKMKTYKV